PVPSRRGPRHRARLRRHRSRPPCSRGHGPLRHAVAHDQRGRLCRRSRCARTLSRLRHQAGDGALVPDRGGRHAVRALAPALVAAALLLCSCGLGPGAGTSNVNVTVTRAFGADHVGSVKRSKVPGSETVMRMLERSFRVGTRYGGGFVEAIDGVSGDSSRHDWFYYVNGIEASKGAAATAVHRGDRIWWDLHGWSVTNDVPAVVGSFPEPFQHGAGGRRLPTTLGCTSDSTRACQTVSKQLRAEGVPVASQ